MYSTIQLVTRFIQYYITASNGKGHGMHSPFVFSFIEAVLNDNRNFYAYEQIELLRSELLNNKQLLEVEDMGAGSASGNNRQRYVKDIAAGAAKSRKLAQLLFRIVNYYKPSIIIELGTSLGISAAYLASGNLQAKLITMEGSSDIVKMARQNFDRLRLPNIEVVQGHFNEKFPEVLNRFSAVDMAFIDGNHQKIPTLQYFYWFLEKKKDGMILIFDDIHWSKEMEQAWEQIKNHPEVLLTIDLFFLGLVFIRSDFKIKQHFSIRF